MAGQKFRVGKVVAMVIVIAFAQPSVSADEPPRVVVSTDIGGSDPDDFQSMVHYLIYADRFETEGLISSPPGTGRSDHLLEAIAAYESDYANLQSWSSAYPSPDDLRRVVRQGATDRQARDFPDSEVSAGAQLIVERARIDDPRPLYVLVWGSITDVAQAVHALPDVRRKLRIYSIGSWNTSQDRKAREYLFRNYPDLWWIESDTTFRGMYMGGRQDAAWRNLSFPAAHIQGHGALGNLFIAKKADIKMGDSPSVLYLLHGDPDTPESEHWGGAFFRPVPEQRPAYWSDNPDTVLAVSGKAGAMTVGVWRSDFLDDWKNRMDRAITVKPECAKDD